MALDALELRKIFGNFATGVTIVTTTNGVDSHYGVTINSFSSLSLDPPLVLFCLDLKSAFLPVIRMSQRFAINILSESQQTLSNEFAKPQPPDFGAYSIMPSMIGVPIFEGCLASIECELHAEHEEGDHAIIIGKVIVTQCNSKQRPLLFYQGRYQRIYEESED